MRPRFPPLLVLAIGIAAVSSSAFLITFARQENVPAIAIAALRLTLSACVLVPFAWLRAGAEWRKITRVDLGLGICSGILLAFHFAFWISSLDYTSVMSSIVLVSTNPFFVALASVLILREPLHRGTLFGIFIAVVGGALVGLSDLGQAGSESLQGDVLALLGAVTVSGYLLIGRQLRRSVSLLTYITLVYASAAIVLLMLALATNTRLIGYSVAGYVLIALLAIGPQLIGHSSYNWALKYVSATFVTVTVLAEPIGATLLAIPILAQVPSPAKLVGGALILAGIYFAARQESQGQTPETADAAAEL